MPRGGRVDKAIKAVERSGKSKSSAIAILKSQGTIRQSGKHLVSGARGKKRG